MLTQYCTCICATAAKQCHTTGCIYFTFSPCSPLRHLDFLVVDTSMKAYEDVWYKSHFNPLSKASGFNATINLAVVTTSSQETSCFYNNIALAATVTPLAAHSNFGQGDSWRNHLDQNLLPTAKLNGHKQLTAEHVLSSHILCKKKMM